VDVRFAAQQCGGAEDVTAGVYTESDEVAHVAVRADPSALIEDRCELPSACTKLEESAARVA